MYKDATAMTDNCAVVEWVDTRGIRRGLTGTAHKAKNDD